MEPLGKKHKNLEPHTQLEVFMQGMSGHLGDDGPAGERGFLRIHEGVRDLQEREPHSETGYRVADGDGPICPATAAPAWG